MPSPKIHALALFSTLEALCGNVTAAEPDLVPDRAAPLPSAELPRRLRGLVHASIVGATYGWRHAEPGDSLYQPRGNGNGDYTNTFYSKFSPGSGFQVGLGGMLRQVLPSLSLAVMLDYEALHHSTAFPFGNTGQTLESSASLRLFEFEVRAIFDRWQVKPYVAFTPGFVHMALPKQEIVWTPKPPYAYTTADAWKSGQSISAALGALLEVLPNVVLDARCGYRRLTFTRTNEGSMSPYAEFAQSFTAMFGLEWWP
jgi:hypothetical protein